MCLFLNTAYILYKYILYQSTGRLRDKKVNNLETRLDVLSENKLEIVRSVSSVDSPTFYQHLCGTRRNAPVIKQHTFIDPFIITSDGLNVENVRCALRRLREPGS